MCVCVWEIHGDVCLSTQCQHSSNSSALALLGPHTPKKNVKYICSCWNQPGSVEVALLFLCQQSTTARGGRSDWVAVEHLKSRDGHKDQLPAPYIRGESGNLLIKCHFHSVQTPMRLHSARQWRMLSWPWWRCEGLCDCSSDVARVVRKGPCRRISRFELQT